jgi:hypothetical protein
MVDSGTDGALSRAPGVAADRALEALLREVDERIGREAESMARRPGPRRALRPSFGGSRSTGTGRVPSSLRVAVVPGIVTAPPEVSAGFLPRHLPHLRRLLGRPLTSPGISRLAAIWRATGRPGDAATLTRENSRGRFDLHRRRFWAAVRSDPQAHRLFTEAGLTFGSNPRTAPYRVLRNGDRMTVTVDHIIERQTRPSLALNPANLRLSSRLENTVLLRQLTERNRRFHGVR